MVGKPEKQSTTYSGKHARYANDGDFSTGSHTTSHVQPYWQGDLQGYYRVSQIKVTSGTDWTLRNAFIGISVNDVTCPGSGVIICGQWPDTYQTRITLTFSCNQTARFVRSLIEVQVSGVPERKSGMQFGSTVSTRLAYPVTTYTVSMATECATLCYKTQPCISFSYRQGGQLNCFLGTTTSSTIDNVWVTYKVKDCFKAPSCY